MVEKIPDLPDNVLGFTAKGTITANDYKSIMIPAVEAIFARCGKVRFLYHLGEDYSGIEAGAMWDDAKLGLKHFADLQRMAVVSDVEWIRWAVTIFGVAMSRHVRVFHNRELTEAKRWVSE
jgi:hypothetical protein